MSGSERSFIFKIVLGGDGAVGKTSIRENFMGKGFQGSYMKTIGADFASKKMDIKGSNITFQIFDLAGQDTYKASRGAFYKGGVASLLVFDLQDPTTLKNLNVWLDEAIENSEGSISTFFVLGNKADLVETRQVSADAAKSYCQQMAAKTGITFVYLETSAKTGMNIKDAFDLLAYRLLLARNEPVDMEQPNVDGLAIIAPAGATTTSTAVTATASPAMEEKIVQLEKRMAQLEENLQNMGKVVRRVVKKLQE
ncbi:MAG: GTP-binding protein [Candidatus Heimdallarchaeota archaeon]|nr:GTP-binding protein [Candidatus Heimdallarchaeota archaeon]MCK5048911.1 GTP-binding protein [Candidatus Heimdallarchaeota archaeon]